MKRIYNCIRKFMLPPHQRGRRWLGKSYSCRWIQWRFSLSIGCIDNYCCTLDVKTLMTILNLVVILVIPYNSVINLGYDHLRHLQSRCISFAIDLRLSCNHSHFIAAFLFPFVHFHGLPFSVSPFILPSMSVPAYEAARFH